MTARHLRQRNTWRKVGTLAAALAVFGVWFLMFRPTALGGPITYSIVSGHSMEPTYHPGDYVIARAQDHYDEGNIVMFEAPGGVVIHRIVGGSPQTGFITQGDNNKGTDPWRPPKGAVLGKAWAHVPGLGRLIAVLRGPIGIGVMAGVLTTLAVSSATSPRGRHREGAQIRQPTHHKPPLDRTAGETSGSVTARPGRL